MKRAAVGKCTSPALPFDHAQNTQRAEEVLLLCTDMNLTSVLLEKQCVPQKHQTLEKSGLKKTAPTEGAIGKMLCKKL